MFGIVDYGMGNLRSVQKALEFIGEKAIISGDFKVLDDCEKLILPGVGSFGAGMREMKKSGLDSYIKECAVDTFSLQNVHLVCFFIIAYKFLCRIKK